MTTVTTLTLTARDAEPAPGALVRDALGVVWERTSDDATGWANWQRVDLDRTDPETWTKVAGNYGPVMLLEGGSR